MTESYFRKCSIRERDEIAASRLADFQRNLTDSIFYTDEFQRIAKNGSRVRVESTYRFIVTEETGKPEIVGVSRDITGKSCRTNIFTDVSLLLREDLHEARSRI